MKTILALIAVSFIASGCTSLDTDFQYAAAANIKGALPEDITISDIGGGWTYYSWKATTANGEVYSCVADENRANPKCEKKY